MNTEIRGSDHFHSVIVLLEEDAPDFAEYIRDLHEIFSARGVPFEILIVANGTEGLLRNRAPEFREILADIKLFSLNRRTSQAVCLRAAAKEIRGDVVVICGSYLQLTRTSFSACLDALDAETDVISPWRKKRVDPSFNQFQSRVFNRLVRWVTGSAYNDLSCTVKIIRKIVLQEIDLYGNLYRFLPVLAEKRGFTVKEVDCEHRQERGKTGFYGFLDYFERIVDILTLYLTSRFLRKPLRFFGAVGMIFVGMGMALLLYLSIQRFFGIVPLGERPVLLLVSVLLVVLGGQAASVGLIGEILAFTQGRNIKEYAVARYLSEEYRGPERRRSKFHQAPGFGPSDRRNSSPGSGREGTQERRR
jgi:hypothetical protein